MPIALAEAPDRWAALADTVFQHYGPDQGLPHQIVTALAEDGDGFIWVGTQGGLARWDGYQFRSYLPDPGRPGALLDGIIDQLHTDPRGRLWIGTTSGGLARYDRDKDRFVNYPVGAGGLSNAHVNAITDDGAGGLWIGTDGGLDHLDPDTGAIAAVNGNGPQPGALPDARVMAVMRDRDGGLWVGTMKGLFRREPAADGFTPVPIAAPPATDFPVATVWAGDNGRIWVGTIHHGVYMIDAAGGTPRPFAAEDRVGAGLQDATVLAAITADPAEVWLGTYGGGIVVVNTATGQTRRIRHDASQPTSLSHNAVSALLRDRAGGIWVGGAGSLNYRVPDRGAIATVFGESSHPMGISGADIYSVLAASDGRVWVGFVAGGIDILDPTVGRVAQLRPGPGRSDSALPSDVTSALAEVGSGEVYAGTLVGTYLADKTGARIALVNVPQRDPHASVSTFLVDNGVLWVGDPHNGLSGFRLDGGLEPIFSGPEVSAKLSDQRVICLARGAGQDLWVGTKNGLDRLDLASHAIETVFAKPGDTAALASSTISALLFDREGRLWVGTMGGGINLLIGREADGRPRFRRFGTQEGLPNPNIGVLEQDAQGRIWASTADGLAVIDPHDFGVRALRKGDGLAVPHYWVGSGAATPAGELLFGGMGGLTVIRPDRLTDWTYRPPVVVTDVRAGGKPMPPGHFNGGGAVDPLLVTADANSLAVEFSALDYTAPERNRYAYRLDGFDKDWIETDPSRRVASYTNLSPGNYVLRVRGSNRLGLWSETALAVPIWVLPAWYQTLWFRLALGVFAAGVVVLIVRLRTDLLRRQKRRLEIQIAERTAELLEAQRSLEKIAYTDILTSLPNRRMFNQNLRSLLAQAARRSEGFALLLLDLDGFKQINDTFGHDAGDALLVGAAQRFMAAVREADHVARLGGDEFAILLTGDSDRQDIERVCQRIIDSFEFPISFKGVEMKTSPSIGIAIYPDDGNAQEVLMKAADVALYAAKRGGRNTWRWHGESAEAVG